MTTVFVSANSSWNIVHFRVGLLREFANAGYRIVVAAPPDEHSDEIRELGFDFHPLPMSRSGMNPVADAMLLVRYRRLMREIRPHAFLGYTIKPNLYGSLAAAGIGAITINTITGLGTSFLRSSLLRVLAMRLYKAGLRRSHRVFFQNHDDLHLFLSEQIVTPEQAALVPGSGIDLNRFQVAPEPPAGPLVFLFIGRLLRDKGIREFVDAARLVRRDLPDAIFRIVGAFDPDNRTSVTEPELNRWIDGGAIEYQGSIDDVRGQVAASAAVVLPSYREGLPRTLLEGAAMGRPLVATDVPGCREIVEEGVTGALCRPRDASSLAQAMLRIARLTPELRHRLGLAARRRVEEQFSEEAVIRTYIDALREAGFPAKRAGDVRT